MGLLPPMHGSQNMNHIRLMKKLFRVKAKLRFLKQLRNQKQLNRAARYKIQQQYLSHSVNLRCGKPTSRNKHLYRDIMSSMSNSRNHRLNQNRKEFSFASNTLVTLSPFDFNDPSFGIFHHLAPSISYF